VSQGYDDIADAGDEDEDDGTYADEEYGKKKVQKKKKQPASFPKPRRTHFRPPSISPILTPLPAAPSRHSPSDSDSDYGSRSKKKKRSHLSGDEIRVSSRGGKVPNYFDDVADFEKFDSDEAGASYYVDPNAQYKEEDEIEAVLTHQRDEERLEDPEDQWFDNIVRRHSGFMYMKDR
jgi:chromodomain-helicase-DNA-binding protein 1